MCAQCHAATDRPPFVGPVVSSLCVRFVQDGPVPRAGSGVHGPATSESVEPQGAVASAQCGATGVRRDRSSFRARRPWPHAPRPSTHDGGSIHDSDSFHTLSHLCSLRHTDTLSALSTTQITHIDTTHQTSFSGAPSCPVRAAWSLEPIPSAICHLRYSESDSVYTIQYTQSQMDRSE